MQLLVRAEGGTLRVLARAPLEALQEMRIPTTGPGLLDLAAARRSGVLANAATLWLGDNLELWADGTRLPAPALGAVRISLPSDRAFASWDSALAHTLGEPLAETVQIPWQQAMLDASFEAALPVADAEIAIRPRFERLGLRVRTALRFVTPAGAVRAFELHGDPGLVRLDPRWHQAAGRFVELGFFHILGGVDHLLFLACLVIPLRRLRQLILVVTSFTVAHSVTLIAATLGLAPKALWFPPLVELLIAASIVWMAFENILGVGAQRRWAITFAFGLVHGFGFSFALTETLQFGGSHLVTSLLAFNLGVELGQVFVLVLAVPLLELLLRGSLDERWVVVLLSALVAHTGWHWMGERAATFAEYRVGWPLQGAVPTGALLWIALAVIVAVPSWRALRGRGRPQRTPSGPLAATARPPIHTE
ncbi:MAG TPA: HupE/UreJ family protein [Thermoanaerobaculia bacterium]|nr:HupE/UreJ family protein [Thermoanaerobaculia bacterium]